MDRVRVPTRLPLVGLLLAAAVICGCGSSGYPVRLADERRPRNPYELAQALGRLNLARVEQEWPALPEAPQAVETLECQPIPQATDALSDLPRYTLYKDRDERPFYIHRSQAGGRDEQWFGPLVVRRNPPSTSVGVGVGGGVGRW